MPPAPGEGQCKAWHWIRQGRSQLFAARRRRGKRAVAFVALFMGAVFGSTNHAKAGAGLEASASANWFWETTPGGATGLGTTKSDFALGQNTATAGTNENIQPRISSTYAGQAGLAQMSINPSASQGGASANAFSGITVMNADPNKWYPYTISLKAYAESGFTVPNASAYAQAIDPQYFMGNSSSGLFMTNTITLQAGSSVYESAAGASASSYFDQTTDLLSSPILTIAITGSPTGLVTADVWFNPDPSLSFSTSASALASLIESSGMGTMSGTSSDISLTYTYDLPSTGVSSSDWIGADGVNIASVPEPGAMTLMVVGLCGALGYLRFGSMRRSS